MTRWSPGEERQFDRSCLRCGKRLRRWWNGNYQAHDGGFICYLSERFTRADLHRLHEPLDFLTDDERAEG